MLVYLKEPMGCTKIGNKIIHGKYFNYGRMGPVNVDRNFFLKHKAVLEQVPITSEWLEWKTGCKFPEGLSFTYERLSEQMTYDQMVLLAHALGIEYLKKKVYLKLDTVGLAQNIKNKIDRL